VARAHAGPLAIKRREIEQTEADVAGPAPRVTPPSPAEGAPASPEPVRERPAWWLGTAAAVAVGVYTVHRVALRYPRLHVEDGSDLFPRFYRGVDLPGLLAPLGGYLQLGTNLLVALACRAPVEWIPAAMAWTAVAILAVACCVPLTPIYSAVASRRQRIVMALLLAWLPHGNFAKSTVMGNAQWNLLAVLVFLVLAPVAHWRRAWPLAAGFTLLVWSHPLAMALSPVVALQAWRAWRRRALPAMWAHAWFLLMAGAYFALGAPRAVEGQGTGRLLDSVPYYLVRVWFELFAGTLRKHALLGHPGVLFSLAAGIVLGAAVLSWRAARTRDEREFVGAAWLTSAALVVGTVAGRGALVRWDAIWGHRYAYVPHMVACLLVVLALGPRALTGWRLAPVSLLLLAWWASLYSAHDFLYGFDPPARAAAAEVRAFTRHLAHEEARLGGRSQVRGELYRSGDFDIRLAPRP
jgi:hypothetical protein